MVRISASAVAIRMLNSCSPRLPALEATACEAAQHLARNAVRHQAADHSPAASCSLPKWEGGEHRQRHL